MADLHSKTGSSSGEKMNNKFLRAAAIGLCLIFAASSSSMAAIIKTGSINDGGTSSSTIYVGYSGAGTLGIDAASALTRATGYLGYNSGTTGTVTVTGTGSTWTNSGSLNLGWNGNGTLNVEAGGQVSNTWGFLGFYSGSTGTANIIGSGSKWTNTSLIVGSYGSGSLSIQAGGQVSDNFGTIGDNLGSTGTVSVTGKDSTWTNSSDLYVGKKGRGTLTVADGGLVTTGTLWASLSDISGNGTITATTGAVLDADLVSDATHGITSIPFGTGGVLNLAVANGTFGIGYNRTGTLRIADGTTVASSTGYLGYNSNSSGAATIAGTGSKWVNNGFLYIGYSGRGTLNIESGGQVSNSNGYMGYDSGSTGTVTVTGDGSKWTNNGSALYVGYSGSGTLNIEEGGQVIGAGYLGFASGSSGTATITGTGSKWTSGSGIVVGNLGIGILNIESGGQVDGSCSIGSLGSSIGTVTVTGDGSKLTSGVNLYVGSGSLSIQSGGQVMDSDGIIGSKSGATGTAMVTGAGSTWTNVGNLFVGKEGNGKLTVANGGAITTGILWASLSDISGNGTITASKGAVLDADLSFDNLHGLTQTIPFGTDGTLNLTVYQYGALGAGYKTEGTLRIADGVTVASSPGYLGYNSGSTGSGIITGVGSTWNVNGSLYVGYSGSGKLTVKDGGLVTASTLWASLNDLAGNGAIDTNGAVLDADIIFNGTHGSSAHIPFGTGGLLRLGPTIGTLGVGYKGTGTLLIADGITVASDAGYIGYNSGSIATATITDAGSRWNSSLSVGYKGNGTLVIKAGGQVNGFESFIGYETGSIGAAVVTGENSKWTNVNVIYVGRNGRGKLTVADSGKVTAWMCYIVNSASAVRLNVSGNDMLVLGRATTPGSMTNKGTVSCYATAFLASGTYTPISEYAGRAITWSGTGSYKAFGGVWNGTAHTFTVSSPTMLAAGESLVVSAGGRFIFTNSATGRRIGASFGGGIVGSPTFSAMPMSSGELDALALTAGYEGTVLSAWNFDTNLTGSEVMLAFDIGTGAENLALWHYSGGVWTPYSADMFTYDANGIVSFTVTGFSGYAVTQVPEPATLALLTLGGLAMLRRRARR